MFSRSQTLAQTDPDLWAAISDENRRQEDAHRADRLGELREPAR